MIDTDKYEGHSKGNWSWGNKGSTDNGDGTVMIRPFMGFMGRFEGVFEGDD